MNEASVIATVLETSQCDATLFASGQLIHKKEIKSTFNLK